MKMNINTEKKLIKEVSSSHDTERKTFEIKMKVRVVSYLYEFCRSRVLIRIILLKCLDPYPGRTPESKIPVVHGIYIRW